MSLPRARTLNPAPTSLTLKVNTALQSVFLATNSKQDDPPTPTFISESTLSWTPWTGEICRLEEAALRILRPGQAQGEESEPCRCVGEREGLWTRPGVRNQLRRPQHGRCRQCLLQTFAR